MSNETHGFSVSVAKEVGILPAVILQHILFVQKVTVGNGENWQEKWVKKSAKAFSETYPYATPKEIRGALDKLHGNTLIDSKIENSERSDRTKSFKLTKYGCELMGVEPFAPTGKSFDQEGKSDVPERANQMFPKGQMYIGSYSSIIDSFVECEETRFAPPTPAESSNLKEEKTESGLVAPPPAESPEPTHLVKLTGPENPGVMEAEGIALPVATALTYDQHPNPKNSQQLKEAMRNYFVANPREWQDGVLEQSRATNWTPEKIADCITAFCAHQEAEGNLKRTYGQYKGMLVKWFLAQPSFDRAKPGASRQYETASPVPSNIRRL